MLGEISLRHWDFVLWRDASLIENGVGFALQQQVSVDEVVGSGDVDGFENESVAVVWARMRRLPNSRNGSRMNSCRAPVHKKISMFVRMRQMQKNKTNSNASADVPNSCLRCLGSSQGTSLSISSVSLCEVQHVWVHVVVLREHTFVDVQSSPSVDSLPRFFVCVQWLHVPDSSYVCTAVP